MIVKVQRPIVSTDPEVGYLFYNEDESFFVETAPSPEIIMALKDDLKMYAEISVDYKDQSFKFIKRVEDQLW